MKNLFTFFISFLTFLAGIILVNVALNLFMPAVPINTLADFLLAVGIDFLTMKVRI